MRYTIAKWLLTCITAIGEYSMSYSKHLSLRSYHLRNKSYALKCDVKKSIFFRRPNGGCNNHDNL